MQNYRWWLINDRWFNWKYLRLLKCDRVFRWNSHRIVEIDFNRTDFRRIRFVRSTENLFSHIQNSTIHISQTNSADFLVDFPIQSNSNHSFDVNRNNFRMKIFDFNRISPKSILANRMQNDIRRIFDNRKVKSQFQTINRLNLSRWRWTRDSILIEFNRLRSHNELFLCKFTLKRFFEIQIRQFRESDVDLTRKKQKIIMQTLSNKKNFQPIEFDQSKNLMVEH